MKLKHKLAASAVATALSLVLATSVLAAPAQVQTSPFVDNLSVNLSNFPGALRVSYHNKNGIHIRGPKSVAKGVGSYRVYISSNNQIESGFPKMTVRVPSTGAKCAFKFIDGPFTYLNYKYGNPPSCKHIQAGVINHTSEYAYNLTLKYKA